MPNTDNSDRFLWKDGDVEITKGPKSKAADYKKQLKKGFKRAKAALKSR